MQRPHARGGAARPSWAHPGPHRGPLRRPVGVAKVVPEEPRRCRLSSPRALCAAKASPGVRHRPRSSWPPASVAGRVAAVARPLRRWPWPLAHVAGRVAPEVFRPRRWPWLRASVAVRAVPEVFRLRRWPWPRASVGVRAVLEPLLRRRRSRAGGSWRALAQPALPRWSRSRRRPCWPMSVPARLGSPGGDEGPRALRSRRWFRSCWSSVRCRLLPAPPPLRSGCRSES